MENFLAQINESARVLGIPVESKLFTDAVEIGREAINAGMDTDTAFEFARRVLLAGVTPALSAA